MQVGEPRAKIVGDPQQAIVSVTVPITEGSQYRWKSISWSGNTALTTTELNSMLPTRLGDIADHSQLDAGLSGVQRAYKSRGYLAVQLKRTPTFDDHDHTVSYSIDVSEGDLFRMGNLRFVGLDPAVADKLQKKWKMNRGDVYNEQYLQTFLKDNAALINEGRPKTVKTMQAPNSEHLVDVTLQF
jgi:outer membrane protein insertion porin family